LIHLLLTRSHALAVFDTALGSCVIVWGAHGVRAVHLPEADGSPARVRALRRTPDARESTPPADVQRAIEGIVALLDGTPTDLSAVRLDMEGVHHFQRRVYEITRGIPRGATTTYGEIAKRLGQPRSSQAVGVALGQNPCPLIVPCHRVLAAGKKLGGFSAPGGRETKLRLLSIEGILLDDEPSLFAE
jgi:methylated-DNA-[protein]-cysteine S-methyltransferase